MERPTLDADVIIVGAGLAGLVAAAEVADAGKRAIIVDQEPEQNLGGQAMFRGALYLAMAQLRSRQIALGPAQSTEGDVGRPARPVHGRGSSRRAARRARVYDGPDDAADPAKQGLRRL